MSILTLADYRAARRQIILYNKNTPGQGTAQNVWQSNWNNLAGDPAAGALSPSNTTTGVVPTSATTGAPTIPTFAGEGYITRIMASANQACRIILYDRLWWAGAFSTATVHTDNLSNQASFINRVPDGDYRGLQIWQESTTDNVGSSTTHVTYTNENGTAGQVSQIRGQPQNSHGAANMFGLAAGDSGVQKIESWVVDTTTAPGSGTSSFNVIIARPLAILHVPAANTPFTWWLDRLHMPRVFPLSCLAAFAMQNVSTSTTSMLLEIEIASKFDQVLTSGVTWSPSDIGDRVGLSNGNLTATGSVNPGGSVGCGRASISRSQGRYYWEVVLVSGASSSWPMIGIKPSALALSTQMGPFGAGGDYGLFMRSPNDGYQTYQPGSNVNTVGPAYANGDVFMFAADLTSPKIWIGRNGLWAGGGDPSTNTGGIAMTPNTWSPSYDFTNIGAVLTARFNGASWSYPCPSGFDAWH